MPPRPHRSLITFALIALGWAQVFGISRGYWCDCSGSIQISQFDHCHGNHGDDCHHDESPSHSHDDHHEEEGDTHEHEPARENLDASTFTAASAPLPLILELQAGSLPDFVVVAPIAFKGSDTVHPPPRDAQDLRRWPRVLSHAVALRI